MTQEGRNPMSIMSEKGMIPIPWLRSIRSQARRLLSYYSGPEQKIQTYLVLESTSLI